MRRALLFTLAAALAAPVATADPLSDLLARMRTSQAAESQETQQRLERFRTVAAERKALLDEVLKELRAEERAVEKLEADIETRQKQIVAGRKRLAELSAHYQEAYAVARLWAVDLHGQLEGSLISSELPGRAAELLPMTRDQYLLTVADLRTILFHTLQEMEQQGAVSRYTAPVIQRDGTQEDMPVVRIGSFTVSSGDEFLRFPPETQNLQVLPRQPRDALRNIAEDFHDEQSREAVDAVIDPSSGTLLSLLADLPSFREIINQGGFIGYLILLIGALGIGFAIFRIFSLIGQLRATTKQSHDMTNPDANNPLGRVAKAYYDNREKLDPESLEDEVQVAVDEELPRLTWGLNMLRMLAAIAPLLGLLGTIVGMIQTFQAITLFGTGDPRMMSAGISHALVTTALGLSVAIPLLLLLTVARSYSTRVRTIIEDHTLGLLARAHRQS